jgi:hypothetical protein
VIAHFRISALTLLPIGERSFKERRERDQELVFVDFVQVRAIGAFFAIGQLVGVPSQEPKHVTGKEFEIALLRLVIFMGLERFFHKFVKGSSCLRDCGVHVVGVYREVVFFGIVLRHRGANN